MGVFDDDGFIPDETKWKTYVYREGEPSYLVHTFERSSSAALSPGARFHVTMVWDIDPETGRVGDIVDECGEGRPLEMHFDMVLKYATPAQPTTEGER